MISTNLRNVEDVPVYRTPTYGVPGTDACVPYILRRGVLGRALAGPPGHPGDEDSPVRKTRADGAVQEQLRKMQSTTDRRLQQMENQNRDEDDRHRYSGLYGFDYGNLDGYDTIIDTNNKEPVEVFEEVLKELESFGFRAD